MVEQTQQEQDQHTAPTWPPREPGQGEKLTAAAARFAELEGDVAPLASRPTGKPLTPLEWEVLARPRPTDEELAEALQRAVAEAKDEHPFLAAAREARALLLGCTCIALALLPALAQAADGQPGFSIPWGSIIFTVLGMLGGGTLMSIVHTVRIKGEDKGEEMLAQTAWGQAHPEGLALLHRARVQVLDPLVAGLETTARPALDGKLDDNGKALMRDEAFKQLRQAALNGVPLVKDLLAMGTAWVVGELESAVRRMNAKRDAAQVDTPSTPADSEPVSALRMMSSLETEAFHKLPLERQAQLVHVVGSLPAAMGQAVLNRELGLAAA